MLIMVDTASGDIRREPTSGLTAGIGGDCVWALAVALQWRGDGTEKRRSGGLGVFRGESDKQHHSQNQVYKIPDELCSSVAMHVNIDIGDGSIG
jgi:hypothetical protein